MEHARPNRRLRSWLRLALIAGVASVLLFARLGERSLWQDEAATAVLGERMLRLGRPLGYDGRNLVSMDVVPLKPDARVATWGAPEDAIRALVRRRDFKADTTWIGHPWGQFLAVAGSFAVLGKGAWQARAPFAVMGVVCAVALSALARRRFRDPVVAWLAPALLLANVFFLLHVRQCRYYAGASLLTLLTLLGYLRWQDGARFGAATFVLAAWWLFQFDYGAFFPVVAVLLAHAAAVAWPRIVRPGAVALILSAAVLPVAWYYELASRIKPPAAPISARVAGILFLANQYVVPIALLGAAIALVWRDGEVDRAEERRVIRLCCALLLAATSVAAISTPYPYLRYLMATVPLGALVSAYVSVRLARSAVARAYRGRRGDTIAMLGACSAALVLALTPLAPAIAGFVIPDSPATAPTRLGWLRAELRLFALELRGELPDPYRAPIERLTERLNPGDEILASYEDIPFMFHTDAIVRGGLQGFRTRDTGGTPPRFAVIRDYSPVPPPFDPVQSALPSQRWRVLASGLPSWPSANNPEPAVRMQLLDVPSGTIAIFERED